MPPIYFDYNASTPVDPAVAAAMHPFLKEAFGNPSSGHWASTPAKAALERARGQVAALIGAAPDEIVFTSGGSEANNLAIKGTFFAPNRQGAHIITSAIEHPAVLAPCRFLERLGGSVTYLPVDRTGRIDPEDVRRAITPQTVLISIMHANNEVGTIQPIREIAAIAREHGIRFHTDAAQSVGKLATKVNELGVDLLSIAGHKLYAPKGVGALYVRSRVELEPLIHGAGHELGRRAGTESALLAVGLGAASVLAQDLKPMERVQALCDRFWRTLQDRFGDGVALNGHITHRLPNTLNVSFVGKIGAEILGQLRGVAASTGSACHSGRIKLSPVLAAMGVPDRIGMGAIRFSLGRTTTSDEIDDVVARLAGVASA
ncbi:cysteine desulfurase family protein [Bradyrhizobium sp. UNPA324]|uniref:cysteine desulfurase family protein n=1 Tax=Bradyrhizobium sp. UNPA324 TaxID=1141174 RepID=UPI00115101EB|nr:cysteine desulfurase family protein [Bradyrhizobium sp. UNPA324]TQF30261.1 cysteine desulfurase [Bradyrhizobium sp. UNPA324]